MPSQVITRKSENITKVDKFEAMLTSVVKEVVDAQALSNVKFLELEEKRIKSEAEQKREEREYQFCIMSMLYSNSLSTRLIWFLP